MYKTGPGMPSGTGYAPQNGQLFFVDTSGAFPALRVHRANQQIDSRLLEEIFRFMKVHHDYARTFVTLREMYNEEEAKAFTGKEPEEALDIIAKMCSIAIVKVGARGSLIRKGTEEVHVEAVPVKNVVDTTGAVTIAEKLVPSIVALFAYTLPGALLSGSRTTVIFARLCASNEGEVSTKPVMELLSV